MFHFIVNPAAKSWHGRECMEKIAEALRAAGTAYEVHETEKAGQTARLAHDLAAQGADRIGLIGGDGTLNELIREEAASLPPVFYVPFGSGNDFARGIKLKVNSQNAPELAVDPSSLTPGKVDIGRAEAGDGSLHRFIVSGGIGFDAAVCWDLDNGTIKKKLNRIRLGFLGYLFLGIKNMFGCPLAGGKLVINDGEQELPIRKLAFLSAHNLPYEGGGFFFAPKAVSHDGLIDLCVVTARNHLRFIIVLFGSVFGGRHIRMKGVHYIRCRKAELSLDRPLYYHTDGEVGGKTDRIVFRTDEDTLTVLQ